MRIRIYTFQKSQTVQQSIILGKEFHDIERAISYVENDYSCVHNEDDIMVEVINFIEIELDDKYQSFII